MPVKHARVIAALMIILGAAPAGAQVGAAGIGEMIIAQNGQLVLPWIEQRVCNEGICRQIVLNPETHEIARVDGRLTNAFVRSGAGQEIVRAPR